MAKRKSRSDRRIHTILQSTAETHTDDLIRQIRANGEYMYESYKYVHASSHFSPWNLGVRLKTKRQVFVLVNPVQQRDETGTNHRPM